MCLNIATRKASIKIGSPWPDLSVVKNMPPLKFYYDLKWGKWRAFL